MFPKRVIPPRQRTPPGNFRDSRLIVIATEGQKTEKNYFESLAAEYRNSRIVVRVLDKLDTRSSPEDVLRMLSEFEAKFKLEEDDMLWLVVDVDHWRNKTLSAIATQCIQKKYGLAVSNPCFELWLLLHVKDIDEYSAATRKELKDNKKVGNRTRLEVELASLLGEYNKLNIKSKHFLPFVDKAISQARVLDTNPAHRWPNDIGTRVYLLAEVILSMNITK